MYGQGCGGIDDDFDTLGLGLGQEAVRLFQNAVVQCLGCFDTVHTSFYY